MTTIKEAVLISKDRKETVALRHVRIDVEVKDIAAKTSITQTFENTEDNAIEAVYCFPVEEGAAICGLEIETDGRIINGRAEEKEKAFEIYDRAIESGDASFLLDRETEDILTVSAGNIKPGQRVTVRIHYVSELPVIDNVIRLQIPTSVSPRYIPPGEDPVKADRITPPYKSSVPYGFGLAVRILCRSIGSVESPSHNITSGREGDEYLVSLADEITKMDRDFILEMRVEDRNKPLCLLAKHENGVEAALLRFYPEFLDISEEDSAKSEVIFVLDCSGSMSGSSIAEAKQALELSLRSLAEGDLFNIVRFGSEYEVYAKESVLYGESTLKKALRYIRSIDANMGGTELMAPMSFVCDAVPVRGYRRDVLLFTDGEVSYPDKVIQLAAAARENMRVFTFGIGYGASHQLIKGVARSTDGACEMIQPGEKIQPKVLRQFSRMTQPCITDTTVSFEGAEYELPGRLPPLYEGDSYTVFAKIKNRTATGSATLKGSYLGRRFEWTTEVLDVGRDTAVTSLWALSRIKNLKDENTLGSAQTDRKKKRIETEIKKLGLEFNLLTDFTSFVAVEKRSSDDKSFDGVEYRRIPVLFTKDWHGIEAELLAPAGAPEALHSELSAASVAYAPGESRKSSNVMRGIAGGLGNGLSSVFGRAVPRGASLRGAVISGSAGKDEEIEAEREPDPWYFDLLATQQAEGSFDGLDIVIERLGVTANDIRLTVKKIRIGTPSLGEKIIVTWLAVRLLKKDAEIAKICGRAIRKAERWLSTKGFSEERVTVDGARIADYVKRELGLSL